jgi:hypothetical protein
MMDDSTDNTDRRHGLRLVYSRRDREKHLSILLPGRLHHQIKTYCLQNDVSLRQLITQIAHDFVKTIQSSR